MLSVLQRTLEEAGHDLQIAYDSRSAIERFERQTFDVLVSELSLPDMGGHRLAQWTAKEHPETGRVLISRYALRCYKYGNVPPCTLLPKPFNPAQLLRVIEQVVGTTVRT